MILYHYVFEEKYRKIQKEGTLKPSAPFNPRIPDKEWEKYSKRFSFPISKLYICCFSEPMPKSWIEYGLFNLLMEEFAGGDLLLELRLEDNHSSPILVREHKFHSPKAYGYPPKIWRERKIRDSRPDLRSKWYESAIPLHQYNDTYICPEILIPFDIPLEKITIQKEIKG